ncbi:hypothetical protein [Roseivivax sp. CAU 1761]
MSYFQLKLKFQAPWLLEAPTREARLDGAFAISDKIAEAIGTECIVAMDDRDRFLVIRDCSAVTEREAIGTLLRPLLQAIPEMEVREISSRPLGAVVYQGEGSP